MLTMNHGSSRIASKLRPTVVTLHDIKDDGGLAFRSTLSVATRGEEMFWCGIVRY